MIACLHGQSIKPSGKQSKDISDLIDRYQLARETTDPILLKRILIEDADQLVSTGEWRNGIDATVKGMLSTTASSPGLRTLKIDKILLPDPSNAIVDCKYEIQHTDGSMRKMWSSFILASGRGIWKITAIRNMLPTGR